MTGVAAGMDGDAGALVDLEPQSDVLLIAFGGLYGELLMPPFEFFGLLGDLPVKRAFLRDFDQAWYQRGVRGVGASIDAVADHLRQLAQEAEVSRIVTTGTSSGGFAALLFGALIGAHEVHAFSPQTTITRRHRLMARDLRWKRLVRAARRAPGTHLDVRPALTGGLASGDRRAHVYYGTKEREDVWHAQRLAHVPGVTLHAYDRGHRLVKHLRDSGELASVLRRATA